MVLEKGTIIDAQESGQPVRAAQITRHCDHLTSQRTRFRPKSQALMKTGQIRSRRSADTCVPNFVPFSSDVCYSGRLYVSMNYQESGNLPQTDRRQRSRCCQIATDVCNRSSREKSCGRSSEDSEGGCRNADSQQCYAGVSFF
jgi:hypothetical protein